MIGNLRHKFAKSVSRLDHPAVLLPRGWDLNPVVSHGLSFATSLPRIFVTGHFISPPPVSSNACLVMTKIAEGLVATVGVLHGGLVVRIKAPDTKDEYQSIVVTCDSYAIPPFAKKTLADPAEGEFTDFAPLSRTIGAPGLEGGVGANLLPSLAETFPLLDRLDNPPTTDDVTPQALFSPTSTFSFDLEGRSSVHNLAGWFVFAPLDVSADRFQPLKRGNPEGKNYSRPKPVQADMFAGLTGAASVEKVRKAYSVTDERKSGAPTIKRVEKLSIWDMLYPMLQPPLDLNFAEQMDFYEPLWGYQKPGVKFLFDNKSALLADEMGTGKTVQTIIALRLLFREGRVKTALIVCPVAVVGNAQISEMTGTPEGWDGHLHFWAPELTVTVVRGTPEERAMDWKYPAHVKICTYDALRSDMDSGILDNAALEIGVVVVDEAQSIKNSEAKRSRAVLSLRPTFRWALTGTPIENRIEDVISIFGFVKPGLFRKADSYEPSEVKSAIAPYLLRRLKKDVLKDLPAKIVDPQLLEMDDHQWAAYREALAQGQRILATAAEKEQDSQLRIHIFALLGRLKQICNFAPEKETSPKSDRLLGILETVQDNKQKALVFSQYDDCGLKPLAKILEKAGIGYVTYKGGMSDAERNLAVGRFRKSPDVTVFLGALRASGLGLNLQEASYVVHFDHWWNPAVMRQAEDRAHRGKKTTSVTVYPFWTPGTIEDKIRDKLRKKAELASEVIDALSEQDIDRMLSNDEWLEMFDVKRPERRTPSGEASSVSSILQRIRSLDPTEFEHLSRRLLVGLGYQNAKVTRQSRDGGIDVFGSKTVDGVTESVVAQSKRTKLVGVKVARELMGVVASHVGISKGFLITSGVFSEDCQRFAGQALELKLIDGNTLAQYATTLRLLDAK